MTSIMERIAEAEKQADAILEEANRTARECVAKARTEADDAIVAAAESERIHTAEMLKAAQTDGEGIAEEVAEKARTETEKLIGKSRINVPEAVAYLMERIDLTV